MLLPIPVTLAVGAAAYSSRFAAGSARSAGPRSAVQACAVATAVSTSEVAKLFGRLAEPVLYLDGNVGACCHSACSDCEWRDPEGGYRCDPPSPSHLLSAQPVVHRHCLGRTAVDLIKATQPKWVCCYRLRDFGDERGAHVPTHRQRAQSARRTLPQTTGLGAARTFTCQL